MSVKINDIYQLKKDVKELQNAVPDIPEVDLTSYYTKTETDAKIATGVAGIVDSAPETLNTLKELSKALGDDPNFATTVTTQLGNKAEKSHKHDFSELEGAPPAVDMSNYYNKVESDNRFIGTDDTFSKAFGTTNNFNLRTSSTINNYKIYGLTANGKSVAQDDNNQIRVHADEFRTGNLYNMNSMKWEQNVLNPPLREFTDNHSFGGRNNLIRCRNTDSPRSGISPIGNTLVAFPELNVSYTIKFDIWFDKPELGVSPTSSGFKLVQWSTGSYTIHSYKIDNVAQPTGHFATPNAYAANKWLTVELILTPKTHGSLGFYWVDYDFRPWYIDPASLSANRTNLNTSVTHTIQLDAPLRSNGAVRDVIDSLNGTLTRKIAQDGTVLTTPIVTSIKCPSIGLKQGLNNVAIVNTLATDIEFNYASSALAGARLNGTDISIVNNRVTELFQSVNSGKTNLETAIIDKGGEVSKVGQVATFQELIDAIKLLKIDDNVGKQIIIDAIKKQIPNCPLTVADTWEKISFYISIVGNIKLSFKEVISNIVLNNPTINSTINIVNEKSIILNIGENINTQQLNSPTITDKLDIQLGTN